MIKNEPNKKEADELKKSLQEHFGQPNDYRRQGSVHHLLIDILFITICAVISGANDLKAVANYAVYKEKWLVEILGLTQGIPSYTTFWAVFSLLNPAALETSFVNWVQSKMESTEGSIVFINGKAQRGTAKEGRSNSFVHIVSAWVATTHVTVGQLKVKDKSNEIKAIPQ